MKQTLIDVETAPEISAHFGRFKVNISNLQVLEPPRMMCFAAKEVGPGHQTEFWAEWLHGHDEMVRQLHRVLDESDVLIHFNGYRFDEPWTRTEMQLAGLKPPSPYKTVDLFQQTKRFYLPSHKLEWVSTRLVDAGGKLTHEGFELWLKCMGLRGTPEEQAQARADMRAYNMRDVEVMEPVYIDLRPWMTGLPNPALYNDNHTERDNDGHIVRLPDTCRCGSTNLVLEGMAYTAQGTFQRFHCADCGAWGRSTRRIAGTSFVEVR